MKRARFTGEAAVNRAVFDLVNKFEYPDELGSGGGFSFGGGGGMAHVLIVSTSEPDGVQEKADFVVPSSNSAAALQDVFDAIESQTGNAGGWTIWMAGIFDLDDDVTAPARCWIRGLGYTLQGGS